MYQRPVSTYNAARSMSHQVYYFLTPTDISTLENWLRDLSDLCILHSHSSEPAPRIVESLNLEEDGKRWLFYFITRSDFVDQIVTRHIPAQNRWTLDELRSPIIEFSACFFDGQILREGRMYYVDGFYGANGRWEDKPESFRTWAKSVFAKAKKMLKRRNDFYIGPDAENWLATSTGKLVTGTGQAVS
jgi:hypothetical protein